jgi:hypothetical protein
MGRFFLKKFYTFAAHGDYSTESHEPGSIACYIRVCLAPVSLADGEYSRSAARKARVPSGIALPGHVLPASSFLVFARLDSLILCGI